MNTFKNLIKDESGATAIEYGLITALVAVAVITVLGAIGSNLNIVFGNVRDGLEGAAGGGTSGS
jgi:pilus assembly protein Flp/PilA